jgi:hypothetical protein
LQLASRLSIAVTGSVHARGGAGYGQSSIDGGGGGGAGGALLFEAPTIALTGGIIVDGGAGGSSGAGAGGAGATAAMAPGGGLSFSANGQGGSGGGGAGGRIRVNTVSPTCPATGSPIGSCTAGALIPQ